MQQIGEFLQKFSLIEDPKKDKMKVLGIISDCLKISISETSLSIDRNKLIITLPPALKSVLFTKKASTIEALEGAISKKGLQIIFK